MAASSRPGVGLSALKVRLHAARGALKHHYRLQEAAWPQTVRPSARTLATHEAGHSVLHWRYGGSVQRVSIEPVSGVWVGKPVVPPSRFRGPGPMELQILMAGEAATFAHHGRSAALRPSGDRLAAAALARHETGGDETEAALLVHAAWLAARELLDDSRIRQQAQRVAEELLIRHQLDGDDLRALCLGGS